jgi:hypothetical protein
MSLSMPPSSALDNYAFSTSLTSGSFVKPASNLNVTFNAPDQISYSGIGMCGKIQDMQGLRFNTGTCYGAFTRKNTDLSLSSNLAYAKAPTIPAKPYQSYNPRSTNVAAAVSQVFSQIYPGNASTIRTYSSIGNPDSLQRACTASRS